MEERVKQPNTPPKKKKPRFLTRVILFLLALIVLLAAVFLVVFRDRINLDSARRWFHYRSLMLSDSGQAESFPYDGDLNDTFAALDGDLLVCSRNAISLYSGSGTCYISKSVSMDHPVVDTNGSLAVVYDAGGSSLYVLGQRDLIWSNEDMNSILSAHINQNGQLTVVTEASGYRGTVTVYDSTYTPLVSVNLSSAFVMDAALSDDGKVLSILTIGQQDGAFHSILELYALNTAGSGEFHPDVIAPLDNNVIIATRHTSTAVWSVGDRRLDITDHQGSTVCADWSNLYLKRYTLSGSGFATALLGKYRAGSQAELWTIEQSGTIHKQEYREQVLSLSAAGRYVAVLTGDRLDIYTDNLELYASLDGTQGARNVLLLADGSAILISAETASFFVP